MAKPLEEQLGLAVQLPDHETFATLVCGPNAGSLKALQHFLAQDLQHQAPVCVISGPRGSGKSHLLHALCNEHPGVMYLAIGELSDELAPEILDGAENFAGLCLDGADKVFHRPDWCFALFSLINRCMDQATGRLIITARETPEQAAIALPDLRSRLQWGLTLPWLPLDDDDKAEALRLHALARGLELPNDVAHYLLLRVGRSMPELMNYLQRLDDASLAAQRRLTIPFIKHTFKL